MLKMERKRDDATGKTAFVFKRLFEDVPEIQTVIMEEDAVEVAQLLVSDFSDFTLSEFFRKMDPKDRVRIFVELFLHHEAEMPELSSIRFTR